MSDFINVKELLCEALDEVKYDNRLTYTEIVNKTCLNKSQLTNILKHKGRNVSAVTIHTALHELGYVLSFTIDKKFIV